MRYHLVGLAVAVGMALPGAAGAHPHVWVSGGADFGLDDEGRLSRVHITWTYDEFASLYMLTHLGVDADGDQVLTEEDKARIIADQTEWPAGFEGDSYLYVGQEKRALGGPENPDTRILETGQVEVTFERPVLEPFRPGRGAEQAVVKVYDPAFYYAYVVEDAPRIIGEPQGCTTERRPYDDNDPGLQELEVELSALGTEETPAMPDVGALFADELRLSCE